MLGKLLKYEFKSTGRIMLPLYGVLLVLAVINGFSFRLDFLNQGEPSNNYIQIFSTFAYFAIVVSIMVITFFNIVTRFYKNLLGEEGYLMFTLPVKVSSLVTSKVIFAAIWSVASFFVITMCTCIMAAISADISFIRIIRELLDVLKHANMEAGFNIYLTTVMIMLIGIVSMLFGLMMIYLAMALGHLRSKGRLMTSIGAYIGLSIIVQFGTMLTFEFFDFLTATGVLDFVSQLSSNMAIFITLGSILLYISVFCYIFHKIICVIIEKRLNLE